MKVSLPFIGGEYLRTLHLRSATSVRECGALSGRGKWVSVKGSGIGTGTMHVICGAGRGNSEILGLYGNMKPWLGGVA